MANFSLTKRHCITILPVYMTDNQNLKTNKSIAVVTGANGFVGSHMADFLLKKGYIVRCIIRKTSNTKWLDDKNVELYRCGLTDVEELKKVVEDADYVYHIAGVVKAFAPEGFVRGNMNMTQNVLEACLTAKNLKRVMVTSSMAATGPAPKGGELDETSPLKPKEPYGTSKVAQEEVAKKYMDRMSVVIVRPPGVYGPRDTEIFAFFKAVNGGIKPKMGFGIKELSLVHVNDLVNGMYLANTHKNGHNEIFFLGSEEKYNWHQLGDLAAEVIGKKAISVVIPKFLLYTIGAVGSLREKWFKSDVDLNWVRAKRITEPSWFCSSKKAVEQIGYKQQMAIRDGFEETVAWYREKEWL
ncbi:MAG: NAD(P)-dependent oxidoreductase [Aureispira sp.]|nr:NAD(P)-dependent oxidoreductase [Aureispira sp.]